MMMMMMKMVRRNPRIVSLLPTLGGMNMNFRAYIQNRSIGTKVEEEKQILCLSVWDGTYSKLRWYGISPPVSASRSDVQEKSRGGNGIALIRFISTKVEVDPSLLCEIFGNFRSDAYVALKSKIYMIGSKTIDYDVLPPGAVLVIDTSCRQITVREGQSPIGDQQFPLSVVLDGKIYLFSMISIWQYNCEVFDPNTNKWDVLPAPPDECCQHCHFYPLVYEKKKKILFIYDSEGTFTFDVTTNSWESGVGVELPSEVLNLIEDLCMKGGEKPVIVDDFLLYMLTPANFRAYDLQKKEILQVHGLEEHTRNFYCHKYDKGYDPPIIFTQLGKKDVCLVIGQGPVHGGLHVVCLKFHVQRKDGGLHAVIHGRDSYYIQDASSLDACVAIKRDGLGTSAISCTFDTDDKEHEM